MTYTYRQATKDDIPAIKVINEAILPENYPTEIYEQHMQYFPTLMIVAETENAREVVGYIMGFLHKDNYALVTSFAVEDNHRGLGIGGELMKRFLKALSIFKIVGITKCALNVRVSNKAINLYKRFGFVVDHTDKEYYEDKEDAYFMTKEF